jgi:hypothetical protein
MKKILTVLIALIAWFAVILQYLLILQNGKGTWLEITIRFFSFFTILTNLLVAICFTAILSGRGRFFTRPGTITAITVYILVVGAVYNIILRFEWQPRGWQMLVDELLHTIVPLVVQVYWFLFVPRGQTHWKQVFAWLIYPAVYCAFIMVRAAVVHEYPYPFIDVGALGTGKVILNCVVLCAVFFSLFLAYLGIDKFLARKKNA